nr:immunoglobulin light chain junction region [Macaca mulatta]MOX49579.1 immunoglobulin light chain junction region [Macaca mulatta]MOX49692.1 immunoglobulin light chain junction region [Macaca mulatta]MOX49992.1 immunoglobulin light chain junction region [Macaca mulatta]MOX50745.1 immunoglobulin light chain junction region [Macaca mulatta]
CQQETNWPRTF